jgi:hypothetical protein
MLPQSLTHYSFAKAREYKTHLFLPLKEWVKIHQKAYLCSPISNNKK